MELIVFCGIQASGKSSFYKETFFNTHVRISLDLLRTRNRERNFIQTCLSTGQPFVIDNTNPIRMDREVYIKEAKERRYKIIGYYFQSKIEDAIARNNKRKGREYIPEVGIKGTFSKLELPSYEEGFDEIYYVQIIDNNFVVSNWEA